MSFQLQSTDLNDSVLAKVADFGLSRVVGGRMQGALATWGWLAPEVILPEEKGVTSYGTPSDVYSFGMVLYEISSRRYPFADEAKQERFKKHGGLDLQTLIFAIAKESLRPGRPPAAERVPSAIWEMIEECWCTDPVRRPTFDQLVPRLCELAGREDTQELSVAGMDFGKSFEEDLIQQSSQQKKQLTRSLSVSPMKGQGLKRMSEHTLTEDTLCGIGLRTDLTFVRSVDISSTSSTVRATALLVRDDAVWIGGSDGHLSVQSLNLESKKKWAGHANGVSCLEAVGDTVWSMSALGRIRVWDAAVRADLRYKCRIGANVTSRASSKFGISWHLTPSASANT